MRSLWRYLGFKDPFVAEFKSFFHPQRCPKAEGFWCLSAYPNSDKILLYGEPSRQDKTWKPYHFLIKGNWEFGTSTEHPEAIIQTRFCQPSRISFSYNNSLLLFMSSFYNLKTNFLPWFCR